MSSAKWRQFCLRLIVLTHWGRVTHICVSRITNIGSDNGLSPGRRQAIIWTNVGILLIRTLGTNFSEILSEIHTFSFKKMHLKMSSAKWRPFCLGLNVLNLLNEPEWHTYLTGCVTTAKLMKLWWRLPDIHACQIFTWYLNHWGLNKITIILSRHFRSFSWTKSSMFWFMEICSWRYNRQ